MYRIDPLPSRQDERNAIFRRRLRLLLVFSLLVIVFSLLVLGFLLMRGDLLRDEGAVNIIGPDGSSILGSAILVSPDYVVTAVSVPTGSQVSVDGAGAGGISVVRSESVTAATTLTLVRLLSSANRYPDLSGAQNGMKAYALSSGERWEGTLIQPEGKRLLEPQPSLVAGAGAAVFAKDSRSLVGVSVQGPEGTVVMSMKEILTKFPEIQKGQ